MKLIEQTYLIKAPIKSVWQDLVDPKIIFQWGGGPASMNARVDSKFTLWGGEIWGRNIKVVPEKLLTQEWFSKEEPAWVEPSIVTITIASQGDTTRLELSHANVPDVSRADIADGWKTYYLGPLKDFLEKSLK